jgi:hypothetical protein
MLDVLRRTGGVVVVYIILVGGAVSATVMVALIASLNWAQAAVAAFAAALLTAGLLFTVREMRMLAQAPGGRDRARYL